MNLEKLKTKRSTERTSVTKLINKLENLLAEDLENTKIEEIIEIKEIIEEKEISLKTLNSEIEDLIADMKDFEKDIASSDKYNEQIISAKCKIKLRLKKCSKDTINENNLNCSVSETQTTHGSAVRLPKISLLKFNGQIEKWFEFFDCFEKAIHLNENLSKIEKFTYLKSLLTDKAYNVIEGFSLTEQNYDSCIEMLKERFGKKDVVINAHMSKILGLEPVKNSSNLSALRKLYDNCEVNIRSLANLGVTKGSYGHLLNPILLKLLPNDLVIEFYRQNDNKKEESDVADLISFLKSEIESREKSFSMINSKNTSAFVNKNKYENSDRKFTNKVFPNTSSFNANFKFTCIFCKNFDHPSLECCNLSDAQKRLKLKKDGRCYKCFLKSHLSSHCRVKLQPCEKCKSTDHNKLFCFLKQPKPEVTDNAIVSNSHCNLKNTSHAVLLQTCCVIAQSNSKSKVVRLLLDSGSEKSFVTKDLARELKLPLLRKEHLTVFAFGINRGKEEEFDVHEIKLRSKINTRRFINVEVLATDLITATSLKSPKGEPEIAKYIANKNWRLADNSLNESKINILLGADYFWKIQRGIIEEIKENLYVANTIFGYTVVGKLNYNSTEVINSHFVSVNKFDNFDLQRFWDLESLGICDNKDDSLSQRDTEIINSFNENLNFVNGRYEIQFLWKENKNELKSNFEIAKNRLWGLKTKLCKNEWLKNEYEKIFDEQNKLGIIEECQFDKNETDVYYMPHRPVVRTDKSTTKVRIVFDASSKEKEAKSLNECLYSGPNLNPNILDIILKFRLHKIAFVCDIEKAFLQIQVAENDRNFLRFLWLDNINSKNPLLKVFRMTRVTFGVTTSPFLLSATIKHHIKGYKDLFEKVVNMLDSSLYVDDLFFGAESVNEAFILSSGAVKILKDANMTLRKFKSNSVELRQLWKKHGINIDEEINKENLSKVLGIMWSTNDDILKIDLQSLSEGFNNEVITKRMVLQTVAKVYDPVGFISPFVIRIKFLMQELWEQGIDWDCPLPDALTQKFKKWLSEIQDLENFEVPRKYFTNAGKLNPETTQIFVFCDASLKGYGTVAYFRDPCSHETSFIMAKTRVAPLKKLTLPRLELMGALTAARLANYLSNLFSIPIKNILCYCDSQITLHWVKGSASNWKPFVENRVREIQRLVAPSQWRFCEGVKNPADVLSRGCTASELLKNEEWLKGPVWIKDEHLVTSLPENKANIAEEEILREQRKTLVCSLIHDDKEFELLCKFSSWSKLRRVTAWCLRFIKNIKCRSERNTGFLTVQELNEATNIILKLVQKNEFREEIKTLKSGKNLNASNKLLSLNPFLDKDGILRVGGRLRHANIPESQKYQMILPKKHHITDLIIRYFHEKHLHSGTQLTISVLRQQYWIINAREAVKRNIRKCMKCFRTTSNLASQLMGDLPAARVVPSRVFSKVGVDLAGPFLIKPRKGRGVKPYKSYICLYICFTTKAIHLEILSDLTSETFLASLKRFVARRGKPEEMFSDRGTNFVGADNEMRKMMSLISSEEKIHRYLSEETIKWNFNPPSAPHFGGLWEAGIKQMKNHLKRTIGEQILTYEQFLTLVTQIESCLNSRPIVALSNDPSDLSALTPGHFIIGTALTAIPEPDYSSTNLTPLERWKLLQKIFQSFWKRWSSDYLSDLQRRSKWLMNKPNFKENDLVLIKEDNQPPLRWKLGRIIKLFPGADGKVRVVELRTVHGALKRPITKLSALPSNQTENC